MEKVKTPKQIMREAKKPVPWESLKVGNWYQCRFDFKEGYTISATGDAQANSVIPVTPSSTSSTSAVVSATPRRTKNKSHRILIKSKFGTESKTIGCYYLTSFGGGEISPAQFTKDKRYFDYIPVNNTPIPSETPFYGQIPTLATSMHGFLNFVEDQFLSGDGVGTRRSERIIHAPESVNEDGRRGEVVSPEWVLPYLRELSIAWARHMETEDAEKMALACQKLTREWIPVSSSKKRPREEEEEEEGEKETGDAAEKGTKRKIRHAVVSSSTSVTFASQSDHLCLDGSSEHGSDSGIFDLNWTRNQQNSHETCVPAASAPVKSDSENEDEEDGSVHVRSELISMGFYELDDEDVDEEVDFELLRELFGNRPI